MECVQPSDMSISPSSDPWCILSMLMGYMSNMTFNIAVNNGIIVFKHVPECDES